MSNIDFKKFKMETIRKQNLKEITSISEELQDMKMHEFRRRDSKLRMPPLDPTALTQSNPLDDLFTSHRKHN